MMAFQDVDFLSLVNQDVFDVVLQHFTLAELGGLRQVCRQLCVRCDGFRFRMQSLGIEAGLVNVKTLEKFLCLRNLDVGARSGEVVLGAFASHTKLESLSACRVVCEDGLGELQNCKNLTSLSLTALPGKVSVTDLEKLTKLTSLSLTNFPLPHPKHQLAALPRLRFLALINPPTPSQPNTANQSEDVTPNQTAVCNLLPTTLEGLTIQGLRAIPRADFLVRLGRLREVVLCDLVFPTLPCGSPRWEKLTIANCDRLTDFGGLKHCSALKELAIMRCERMACINPDATAATLPNLTHLTLTLNPALQSLARAAAAGERGGLVLPALVSLKVQYSPLLCVDGNKGTELSIFEACGEVLEELVLERCKVTDPEFALKLPNLRVLSVVGIHLPSPQENGASTTSNASHNPATASTATTRNSALPKPSQLRTLTLGSIDSPFFATHFLVPCLKMHGASVLNLTLFNAPISNLRSANPLTTIAQFCPNLTSLSVSDCPSISSLQPLTRLPHLVHLNIKDVHSIESLAPLRALHKLTSLELNASLQLHARTSHQLAPLVDISKDQALRQRLVHVHRLGVPSVSTFEHGVVVQRWYATEAWIAQDNQPHASKARDGKWRSFWHRAGRVQQNTVGSRISSFL